jgi:uncharacterized protein YndB with AHSA1/START domain
MEAAANEIIINRLIDAPRDLVWRMWTEPEHLEKWWGPNGFTVTTHDIDIRVGGEWNFIMHGPDGRDYPNKIVFTEIVKPEHISHDHGADDGVVQFQAIITFEEMDGKTNLTMKSIFPSAKERDRVVREVGAIEGAKQTIGRLAAYVESL